MHRLRVLAIIAADLFPKAKVDAIDSSPEALLVAARNVTDYQLDDRVTLIKSDMFAGVANKRYDVILCNPPYVTDAAMAKLPKEYAHEPKLALAGGPDGMRLVKTIVRQARGHLKRGGVLIVEVGDGRAAAEKRLGHSVDRSHQRGDDMVFLARQEEPMTCVLVYATCGRTCTRDDYWRAPLRSGRATRAVQQLRVALTSNAAGALLMLRLLNRGARCAYPVSQRFADRSAR